MSGPAALPFTIRRGDDVVGWKEITSTKETVHGLLRLQGDNLVVQWRVSRVTDRVGLQIRTEHEFEEVQEVAVPLSAIAGATVRRLWFRWPPGRYLVLTAGDLRAFEQAAGVAGLRLEHPAELVVRIRRGDRMAAQEFAGELQLAVAERALLAAERRELPS